MHTPESENAPRPLLNAWAEFCSPETEAHYRQSRRAEQTLVALLIVIAALLRGLVLIPSDLELLGAGTAFWNLMWGRVAFAVLSLGMLIALQRNLRAASSASPFDSQPPVMERLLFLWCVLAAIAQFVAGSTRGSFFFLGDAYSGLITVLVWYLVVPLPFRFQVGLALISTAGDLYLLSRNPELHHLIRRSLLVSLVLVNLMAAATTWVFHRVKRREFAALRREEELRAGLQSALAEVRTLRGILPICAHCKRVRTDEGSWQQVEEYVRDHTEAEFSHGICPECVQTHFAPYLRGQEQERRHTD